MFSQFALERDTAVPASAFSVIHLKVVIIR